MVFTDVGDSLGLTYGACFLVFLSFLFHVRVLLRSVKDPDSFVVESVSQSTALMIEQSKMKQSRTE